MNPPIDTDSNYVDHWRGMAKRFVDEILGDEWALYAFDPDFAFASSKDHRTVDIPYFVVKKVLHALAEARAS